MTYGETVITLPYIREHWSDRFELLGVDILIDDLHQVVITLSAPPIASASLSSLKPLRGDVDPFANDPGHWGASAATLAELLLACLDAARPRSVAEIGAYAGDLTALLLDWAEGSRARIVAIDPMPQPELVELAERHPNLDLVAETSLDALAHLPLPTRFSSTATTTGTRSARSCG